MLLPGQFTVTPAAVTDTVDALEAETDAEFTRFAVLPGVQVSPEELLTVKPTVKVLCEPPLIVPALQITDEPFSEHSVEDAPELNVTVP